MMEGRCAELDMAMHSLKRRHFIRTAAATLAALPALALAAGTPALPVILVLGDSLSAEYGLPRGSGWVALLVRKLAAEQVPARVVNASISGDTTAGGRARLPALLKTHQPRVVLIELGGNDALRGLPMDMTEANLTAMTRAARQAGARVLLAGMQMPPNYGAEYGRRFAGLYPKVARAEQAALVPFFLQGVADDPDPTRLFQADRIHPSAQAQPIILHNVWPLLRPLLPAPPPPPKTLQK